MQSPPPDMEGAQEASSGSTGSAVAHKAKLGQCRGISASEALLLAPPGKKASISHGQIFILVTALFLKGGLLGAYTPFSALWLSKKGFAPRDLGVVALVDSGSSLLLPLIGGTIDRLRAHNSCFAGILALLAVLKLCYLPAAHSFTAILVLTSVTAPLMRSSSSLLDSLALYAFPERGHYSRARLFGDLGFGLLAVLTGIAMDASGTEDAIFWKFAEMCATLSIIWLLVSPLMSNIRPDSRRMTNAEFGVQLRLFTGNFLNFGMARALFLLYLLGSTLGLIGMFEFVLLEEMNGSGLLLGSCKMVGAVCAIPCWWWISKVMEWVGFKNIQLIALAACALRLFILSVITRPEQAIFSEMICGLGGFAFAYSSITIFLGRFVDEDMKATAQSIVFVVYVGIGAGGAPILGALLVEWYGIQGMYFYASALLASVFACTAGVDFVVYLLGRYERLEDSCQPPQKSTTGAV